MPIQYAGVDLLLEDPQGIAKRWLARYQPLGGLELFGDPSALVGSRTNPRSNVQEFTALPTPNYPPMPKPKINALYWPTGALRWGYGLFLADQQILDDILTELDTLHGQRNFVEAEVCRTCPFSLEPPPGVEPVYIPPARNPPQAAATTAVMGK